MRDATDVAGVEVTGRGNVTVGVFTEDAPATPQQWRCQHCGKLIDRSIRASYNGAPLCLPQRDTGEANCYRRVSTLNHQMPCLEDPCPGDVTMEHDHGAEHGEEGH